MRALLLKTLVIALVGACSLQATAAEVRLLSEAVCHGPLVLLGDIAEVLATDESRQQELAGIELFPAPPQGRARQLSHRELQDLLVLRGIPLSDCRFFGASTTTIRSQSEEPALLREPTDSYDSRPLAEQRLGQAIADYLAVVAGDGIERQVEVSILPQYAASFARLGTQIIVSGGAAPWQGRQSFHITLHSGIDRDEAGTTEFTISAEVKAVRTVVVAVQRLTRGQRVTAADVQLVAYEASDSQTGLVVEPEAIFGLELTTSVQAGRPLRLADLRAPRLVKRNESVTMIVRREGVAVRSMAKALGEGAEGDMIEVQSLNNRERFHARVIGLREVEIGALPGDSSGAGQE